MKVASFGVVRARFRNLHPRTRKAQINTAVGLAIKGGGMLISLLVVPMTLDYLSKGTYGTWLTISSIVNMLAFFDIGIGNGLRNKLSEAISTKNLSLARSYVSTAYLIFGLLQLGFILVFLAVFRFIPWNRVLNTTIDTNQLQLVVMMTFIAIALKLVLDIITYILYALQESGRVSWLGFLPNLIILIGTFALLHVGHGNLIYIAILTTMSPVVVVLVSSFILYRGRLAAFRPSWQFANRKYARSLLSLGSKFFVIQMAVVVVFYTDNIIITQLFGPAEVTTYNIAFRYFNAVSTIFLIAITPYWSAFTEASVNNDTEWMKRTYSYLQKLWVALLAAVVLMIVVANLIYTLWVGDRIMVPYSLTMAMALSVLIICWNNVTVSVINGLGKVKLQLLCSIFAALSNIPLAVLFGRELGLGSAGVMLATCVSLLPASFLGTIQAKKLINGSAQGIWRD